MKTKAIRILTFAFLAMLINGLTSCSKDDEYEDLNRDVLAYTYDESSSRVEYGEYGPRDYQYYACRYYIFSRSGKYYAGWRNDDDNIWTYFLINKNPVFNKSCSDPFSLSYYNYYFKHSISTKCLRVSFEEHDLE